MGGRSEVLGAVLGPGVDSVCWDLVDPGWGTRPELAVTLGAGATDVQTVSMLALPGMATELQFRWGLQVSVDDFVSENVPGAQGAHSTFDVAVPGVATPKPGSHCRCCTHCRQPSCLCSVQYQPGRQVHIRLCTRVQS